LAALLKKGSLALKSAMQIPANRPNGFEIICAGCGGLGIILDSPQGAPSSTVVTCRHCGAPRGTLGDLRSLSTSGKQDLFEI
jgi:ribosomal protein S27E